MNKKQKILLIIFSIISILSFLGISEGEALYHSLDKLYVAIRFFLSIGGAIGILFFVLKD